MSTLNKTGASQSNLLLRCKYGQRGIQYEFRKVQDEKRQHTRSISNQVKMKKHENISKRSEYDCHLDYEHFLSNSVNETLDYPVNLSFPKFLEHVTESILHNSIQHSISIAFEVLFIDQQ
jgi:hypothetical protein